MYRGYLTRTFRCVVVVVVVVFVGVVVVIDSFEYKPSTRCRVLCVEYEEKESFNIFM